MRFAVFAQRTDGYGDRCLDDDDGAVHDGDRTTYCLACSLLFFLVTIRQEGWCTGTRTHVYRSTTCHAFREPAALSSGYNPGRNGMFPHRERLVRVLSSRLHFPAVPCSHSRGPKPVTRLQDCCLNLHFSTSDVLFHVPRSFSKSEALILRTPSKATVQSY